jgi:hypothetical protein
MVIKSCRKSCESFHPFVGFYPICDIQTKQIKDSFLVDWADISPDKNFLAFVKYRNRYSDETADVRVYDLSLAPNQNRTPDIISPYDKVLDAGLPVLRDREFLVLNTSFSWFDDKTFIFSFGEKSEIKAAIINLKGGVSSPVVNEVQIGSCSGALIEEKELSEDVALTKIEALKFVTIDGKRTLTANVTSPCVQGKQRVCPIRLT